MTEPILKLEVFCVQANIDSPDRHTGVSIHTLHLQSIHGGEAFVVTVDRKQYEAAVPALVGRKPLLLTLATEEVTGE